MINDRNLRNAIIGAIAIAAGGLAGGAAIAEDGALAKSGEYTSDAKHQYITFSYDYFGYARPQLRWRDWNATLDWNAAEPAASSVTVMIDAHSIDTGVDEFDGHLRGDKFFDVENHPAITFASTSLTKTGEHKGVMIGDLTIKGVTKPVTLNVTLNKADFNKRNNEYRVGFSANGVVKRSDFGVDLFAPGVSDEVDLNIQTLFKMPAEAE